MDSITSIANRGFSTFLDSFLLPIIVAVTVLVLTYIVNRIIIGIHKKRIYLWLKENTKDKYGDRYRSTRAIASATNLTKERVNKICSIHKKIYFSTGAKEDRWSIILKDGETESDDPLVRFV